MKRPLISHIELKVGPHTSEGKELTNNLEHYRLLMNLRLPRILEVLEQSSAAVIDSMVEMARTERASKEIV